MLNFYILRGDDKFCVNIFLFFKKIFKSLYKMIKTQILFDI